jgi:lysophospholipase L1-like esterase
MRFACLAATALLVVGCGSSGSKSATPSSTSPSPVSQSLHAYPTSIVVLGHSGATGLHSDPTSRPTDARQNSWATGDNPDVDSIYTRLLALNPAVRGHNANVAVDGTGVKELADQADKALAIEPRPDLFLIETVDNDMRCDGTDAANLAPFGAALEDVIRKISLGAPEAHIFMVSSPWSTSESYFTVAQQHPGARASNTGTGLCDLFSPSGEPLPDHQSYLEQTAQQYLATVESVCAKFPACRYDKGALHNLVVTPDDLTPEGFHLTISGQQKVAAIEWAALAL